MPFYVFSNYTIFLNEIIEEENKGQKGDGRDNDPGGMMSNAQNTMKSTMSGAKNMMGNMRMPKI